MKRRVIVFCALLALIGARRIVAGAGAAGDARTSSEYYYTDDHYNSFRRIRE